jgi:hypothetical protein
LNGVEGEAGAAQEDEAEERDWPSLNIVTRPAVSIGVGTTARAIEASALYEAVDRVRSRAKVHRNKVVTAAIPEAGPRSTLNG